MQKPSTSKFKQRIKPSGSFVRLKVLCWSLLAVVLLSGFVSLNSFSSSKNPAQIAAVEKPVLVDASHNLAGSAADCVPTGGPAGDQTVFGGYYSDCEADGASTDPYTNYSADRLAKVVPESASDPITCDIEKGNGCFVRYSKNPSGLLPAWRWRDNVGLYSNMPLPNGITEVLFSMIASLFFAISQMIWWILLEVCQWVLTDTLVQNAGTAMNKGFLLFVDLFNASGLFLLLAGLGILTLARLFFRGRLVKSVGLVLAFIIPIGAMQGLAAQAAKTPSSGPKPEWAASDLPTGSPAWFAVSGVNLVDGFTSWFTSGFGRLSAVSGSMQIQEASAVDPSCASYVAALYDQYYAYSSSPVRAIRLAAEPEFQAQLEAFKASPEAKRMQRDNPQLWNQILEQANLATQANTQLATQLSTQGGWSAMMANRSSMDKLADARHYRVATVSQLWHRAFLGSWTSAQFGNQVYAAKMYCHLLEQNGGVSTQEQYAISQVANKYSYIKYSDGTVIKSPGYERISAGVFDAPSGKDEKEQRLFAWAACRRVQKDSTEWVWQAEPAWAALGGGNDITDRMCEMYFMNNPGTEEIVRNTIARGADTAASGATKVALGPAGWIPTPFGSVGNIVSGTVGNLVGGILEDEDIDRKGNIKPLIFKDEKDVEEAVAKATIKATEDAEACKADVEACSNNAAQVFSSAKEAGNMVLAFKGHNPMQRLSLSLLAVITAAIYVYALGFLALGTFLAKFGLVLMIIVLPAALLLLAIPSTSGSQSGPGRMGRKMLRMTGGFLMSHGMLTFVLGLVLSMILVFEAIFSGNGIGAFGASLIPNGDGGGFIHALIPLAALYVVRTLLKAAGLGDLGSIQGALGMPLAAALSAGGKDVRNAAMGKFNSLTGGQKYDPRTGEWKNKGLTRLDAFAKRTGKKALTTPVKKAGDKLGYPEAKKYLAGSRNADGVLEGGLAQRMKNMYSLFAMPTRALVGGASRLPIVGGKLNALGEKIGESRPYKAFNSLANSNRLYSKLKAQDATARELQRRNREDWRAVASVALKGSHRRHEVRTQIALQHAESRTATEMALRDASGKIVRDASGKAVYGYKHSKAIETHLGSDLTDDAGRPIYALENAATNQRVAGRDTYKLPSLDAQRKSDGTLITGAGGRQVYGWLHDDGKALQVLDWDEYQALSPAEKGKCSNIYNKDQWKKGYRYVHDIDAGSSILNQKQFDALSPAEQAAALSRAITDPTRAFFTDDEMISSAREFSEYFQLQKGQFVASSLGLPIIIPAMADASGKNGLLVTKNAESSRELAAHMRIQYLPNDQKARPAGWTDDQYAVKLKLMNEYLGGYDQEDGSMTDLVMEVTGHAWNSEAGKRELTLALQGKDCKLSSYRPEIPPEVMASINAAASQYSPRAEKAEIFQDIAAVRYETLADTQDRLVVARNTINSGTVELETYSTQFRALAPKLKTVTDNLRNLADRRAEHTTATDELTIIDDLISNLERDLAAASASTNPYDRSRMAGLTARLTAERSRRNDQAAVMDALEDAVSKLAASEAEWVREQAQSQAAMDSIRTKINDVSRSIFDASKEAEELGMQMEFAFKAFRRDKGKETWSNVDDAIDDWVKAHNNRWSAEGRDLRALENALDQAISGGEAVSARLSAEEIVSVVNSFARRASRESAVGAAKHGHITNELAKIDGSLRYIVETNPEVIPWTGDNYMKTVGRSGRR
jgi:hypothetical protein